MTLDDLGQWLRRHQWGHAFNSTMLGRGRQYARDGRVLDLSFEPYKSAAPEHADAASGEEFLGSLLGTISGSRTRPYTCRIEIRDGVDGRRLHLQTVCSCPVGIGCKHAAALLVAAERRAPHEPQWKAPAHKVLERDPPVDLQPWQSWLDSLTPKPHHAADAERQFGILLRGENGQLLAVPAWLRPSKNKAQHGALVDPQIVQLDDQYGAVPTPGEGWSAEVASDLTTLLHAPESWTAGNQHWRTIRSMFVEQALERLLARYPAWYERGRRPVTRGEPLVPELYWEQGDQATQRLALRLPVPDAVLLYGAGVWYVHPRQGRYGRIDGDPLLLQRLRHAPALGPRQAAAVYQQLSREHGAHALPAPVDHGEPISVRDAPVGVLQLRSIQARTWNGGLHTLGLARVAFDYAGVRVATRFANPLVRSLHAQRVYEIQRRLGAEQALLQRLEGFGLQPAHYSLYGYQTQREELAYEDYALLKRRKPLPPEDWKPVIDALAAAGFCIEYAPDFPRDELVEIDDWYGQLTPSGNAWFEVALGVVVNGERVDLLPVLRQVLADRRFPLVAPKGERKNATWRIKLDETRSIELSLARLRALVAPLLEWLESEHDGEPRVHKSRAAELDAMGLPWRGGEALRAQLERLAEARKPARAPRGFQGTLRPYQRDGLAWLNFLSAAHLGGILADDMGLGKTIQVLAHILREKQHRKPKSPALVIAPTSLVGNWQNEARRFTPTLKVLVLHGAERAGRYHDIPSHDLVITTYPLLRHDRDKLIETQFSLLVLDEAQAIKNAHSQAAQVVREIPATRHLAMTGTPLENHLGELWAQFDAVEPGLLGSERQFKRSYRTPIEKHGDADRQQRLNRRVGALLLRRRKEDVLKDLPPKNEIVRTLEIDGQQRELYETLRLAQHERVRKAIKKRGLAQAGIIILDALLKLRQACCDPRLVKLESARKVRESAKLDALLELLTGLLAEGRRVLLFSQFTEMLGLIETALHQRAIDYQALTGQTPGTKRTALVRRFQDGKVSVFLISLKAGGLGLNLTAADTVIHYDPWWNPAVEAQATDRAHRIGQDKPVFVYRLICAGTVEEKIQALQMRKAELAKAVLEGGASKKLRFDQADLAELFAPL